MTKKIKNQQDDWAMFISTLFARKRANRTLVMPRDYIVAIADGLHKSNPSRKIIINTLTNFTSEITDKGYQKRISDAKFFKNRQEQHFKEYWDGLKDYIDDVIHGKVEPKASK